MTAGGRLAMRSAICALATLLVGCWELHSDAQRIDRGHGIRVALDVYAQATTMAVALASVRGPACPTPPAIGPLTVSTRIDYVRKLGRLRREPFYESQTWTRDEAGNIGVLRTLSVPLPDGRQMTRTYETRRVDDQWFRARDGVWVVADRAWQIDIETAAAATGLVDGLLSQFAVVRDRLVMATTGAGLCDGPRLRGFARDEVPPGGVVDPVGTALPDPVAGALVVRGTGRSGWARWADTQGLTLTVAFVEEWHPAAVAVVAPAAPMPVDAVTDYGDIQGLLDTLRNEGLLQPSRVQHGPPLSPSLPDPHASAD